MHIVYLCSEYPPSAGGGIGSFTRTLARGMVQAGWMASVVGFYSQKQRTVEDDLGVQVFRLPESRTPGLSAQLNRTTLQRQLRLLHQECPIDILEGQENAFWGLSKETPGRKVIRMHGGHHFFAVTLGRKPALRRGLIERLSFQHADHLCAVSQFVAETTRKLLNLGSQPIRILPNPVDTRLFRPHPEIAVEPGLILFAGTICEKKGIRQLVDAMPEIIRASPQAHLVALGRDGRDDQTGDNFRIMIERGIPVSLRDKIVFQGAVPHTDLPAWLARAEVCVYPSYMEAMPIAWLEAMSCGKAVVASTTGPGPELIADGENGLLCDPHDPAAIAGRVIRLLQDAELRLRLGLAARQTVEEKFSIDRLVGDNLDFYQTCLRERGG